ncbi:cytochrome P450 family protein [Mycobacterium xenopi 3993]|nr:cytochrome P450 family protein [Mycobacterium xenopi 3993]
MLCHTEDEDGNSFTDEDIVNHMIFLMMAAHDTSTSTTTTMAFNLAAHPEWQERCRDESARLGDGPLHIESLEKLESLDLVMNESLRLVTPLPFNMRQTVRDTDLLGYYVPAGTNVMIWPGMNHWLPELWTEPRKFDPSASPNHAPSTRGIATHLRRSAAGRTSASEWCSGSWKSRPSCTGCCAATGWNCRVRATGRATTTVACQSRSTACRSYCGRSSSRGRADTKASEHTAWRAPYVCSAQASSRLAQAMTARRADSVRSCDQPIAHSERTPLLPQMNVAVCSRECIWWNRSVSTRTPRSCSIAVSAATGPLAAAIDVVMRSRRR